MRYGVREGGPGKEEGVLHVAGRMIGREVESFEIIAVGLDLGPFGHGESSAEKTPTISSITCVMGWRRPRSGRRPGSDTSTLSAESLSSRAWAWRIPSRDRIASSISRLAVLTALPASAFSLPVQPPGGGTTPRAALSSRGRGREETRPPRGCRPSPTDSTASAASARP